MSSFVFDGAALYLLGIATAFGFLFIIGLWTSPVDESDVRVLRVLSVLIALFLLAAFGISRAHAHGPWPWACCADNDCDEIDARFVKEYPEDDTIRIAIPPGGHKLWTREQTTVWRVTLHRSQLKKPVTGEWGLCIKPYTFEFLCAFPPMVSG